MSAEANLSQFVADEYAASGIEVRGTAPGLVTVALPHQVDDFDEFIQRVSQRFAASVDARATERGVELDFYPHSIHAEPEPHKHACSSCCWWLVTVACMLASGSALAAVLFK